MTRGTDWGLLRNPQGRIVGVYSQSDGAPVKTAGFPAIYASFESAATYNDWKFTAVPQTRGDGRPPGAAAAASSPISRPCSAGRQRRLGCWAGRQRRHFNGARARPDQGCFAAASRRRGGQCARERIVRATG